MKNNTLPLTQANFDVVMTAMQTLAKRVSQLERKVSILEANKASKYEGDVG